MAERAVQLLCLEPNQPAYLLDVGTGSGLSGEVLTEMGYEWVGCDISPAMLGIALEREVEGDLICTDMGQGMSFRAGTFDGCISISALQWLCNADKTDHIPERRLKRFFTSLYRVLAQGARAVFQFYPEGPDQLAMINKAALKAGFNGGVVVDYPNSTKAKKYFLCLNAGENPNGKARAQPRALGMGDADGEPDENDDEEEQHGQQGIKVEKVKTTGAKRHQRKGGETAKQWIARKKDRQRKQGKQVVHDSKYSARSRGPRF